MAIIQNTANIRRKVSSVVTGRAFFYADGNALVIFPSPFMEIHDNLCYNITAEVIVPVGK